MKKDGHIYSRRVIFPPGGQRRYLLMAKSKLGVSTLDFAALLGVHRRTLNGWQRENFSMSLSALKKVSKKLGTSIPSYCEIKDPFWYTSLGSQRGWLAVKQKYGRVPVDEKYRQQKWREWWEATGQYQTHPIISVSKPCKKPPFSPRLAEFVGIMMGDGGITKYQIKITLHSEVDREYALFVRRLIEEIFFAPVSTFISKQHNFIELIVSRRELVKFCNGALGLPIGDKLRQGLDVPVWIKQKDAYFKRCLRGLIDTDGCVFYERHRIGTTVYSYPRLNFTSLSPALIASVATFLVKLGFSPKIRRHGKAVQLENDKEIRQYFDSIGTSNPKHQQRFLLK